MKKIALIAAFTALALTGCVEKGNGEKLGVVTKLAKQGAFCPTWEAEIVRGGLIGGSGVNGAAFHFTIESDDLANKLKDAMENQKEVKITYRTEMFTFCRSAAESENHFLQSIEVVEPKKAEGTVISASSLGTVSGKVIELLKVQAELIKELVAQQAQAPAAKPVDASAIPK